jgi:hypothetical protein
MKVNDLIADQRTELWRPIPNIADYDHPVRKFGLFGRKEMIKQINTVNESRLEVKVHPCKGAVERSSQRLSGNSWPT